MDEDLRVRQFMECSCIIQDAPSPDKGKLLVGVSEGIPGVQDTSEEKFTKHVPMRSQRKEATYFSLSEIIRYEVTVNQRNIEGEFARLPVIQQSRVSSLPERLASLSHPRRRGAILVPTGYSPSIPLTRFV